MKRTIIFLLLLALSETGLSQSGWGLHAGVDLASVGGSRSTGILAGVNHTHSMGELLELGEELSFLSIPSGLLYTSFLLMPRIRASLTPSISFSYGAGVEGLFKLVGIGRRPFGLSLTTGVGLSVRLNNSSVLSFRVRYAWGTVPLNLGDNRKMNGLFLSVALQFFAAAKKQEPMDRAEDDYPLPFLSPMDEPSQDPASIDEEKDPSKKDFEPGVQGLERSEPDPEKTGGSGENVETDSDTRSEPKSNQEKNP